MRTGKRISRDMTRSKLTRTVPAVMCELSARGEQVDLAPQRVLASLSPRQATTRWRARGATSRTRTTMKRRNSDPRCAPPRHSPRTPAAARRTAGSRPERRAPPRRVPTFLPPTSDDRGLTERTPRRAPTSAVGPRVHRVPHRRVPRHVPPGAREHRRERRQPRRDAHDRRGIVQIFRRRRRGLRAIRAPLAHRVHPERPPGRRLLRHDERARNRRRRRRGRGRGRARERLGRATHERSLRATHTGPRRPGGRGRKPATPGQDRRRGWRRKHRRRRRRESNPRRRGIVLRRPPPSAPRREGDAQRPRAGSQGSKKAPALHQPRRAPRGGDGGGRTRAHQRVAGVPRRAQDRRHAVLAPVHSWRRRVPRL